MEQFNLGDKVKHKCFGKGIIKGIILGGRDPLYSVEFKFAQESLHDCYGDCKNGHGWVCNAGELEKVDFILGGELALGNDKITLRKKEENKKCSCSSYGIFNFGCKCGGV